MYEFYLYSFIHLYQIHIGVDDLTRTVALADYIPHLTYPELYKYKAMHFFPVVDGIFVFL